MSNDGRHLTETYIDKAHLDLFICSIIVNLITIINNEASVNAVQGELFCFIAENLSGPVMTRKQSLNLPTAVKRS